MSGLNAHIIARIGQVPAFGMVYTDDTKAVILSTPARRTSKGGVRFPEFAKVASSNFSILRCRFKVDGAATGQRFDGAR